MNIAVVWKDAPGSGTVDVQDEVVSESGIGRHSEFARTSQTVVGVIPPA